jgi:SAM-dependent methyltransferase
MSVDEKKLLKYYNREYPRYAPLLHVKDSKWKVSKILPLIQEGKIKVEQILDTGCGAGFVLKELLTELRIAHGIGVDISTHMLKVAKRFSALKDAVSLSYIKADAATLPLKNQCLDMSLLIDVVEHVFNPYKVLLEQARVSRYMIVKVPLTMAVLARGILFSGHRTWKERLGHIHHFNMASFFNLIDSTGFDLVTYRIVKDDRKKIQAQVRAYVQKNVIKTFFLVMLLICGEAVFRLSKEIYAKMWSNAFLIVLAKNRHARNH